MTIRHQYASLKERENMDKKQYYRQSAIVFSLLSAVFFIVGLSVVTQIDEEDPGLAAVGIR